MTFIKVHQLQVNMDDDGKSIPTPTIIQLEQIAAMYRAHDSGTWLFLSGREDFLQIVETPDQILDKAAIRV